MLAPGSLLVERFEIERLAAHGGMSAVYRARDRHTGQPIALKALRAAGHEDAQRFLREAAVLGDLQHPGIVRYIAHGIAPGGERYLAVEWLEGETLADRLARGRLGIDEAVSALGHVATTLGYLHARGVVHRDVKPANVFLLEGRVDRVKILDFGLARLEKQARELTVTGAMVGTPGYMAPEQARGQPDLDARADVFALGCMLFKCITGELPFSGDDVLAILLRIVLEDPPRPSDLRAGVPPALDDLVLRMLAKSPADRPEDGAAVAAQLEGIAACGLEVEAAPASSAGLTITEQRLMTLVLARPTRSAASWERTHTSVESGARDARLAQVAARFRGTLEPLADGSLVVGFAGAGGAATDQAARAARCALALQPLLPRVPLVVVSGRGVMSARLELPVGEVIDRGVRLLARHLAGQVLLDELTAGLLGSAFDVHADSEGLYLRSERDPGEAERTLLGKVTPYVGRDRELATLLSTFEECSSEPVARAVLVVSPAGYGKSRLRYEFLRALAELAPATAGAAPLEVWVGRGDPMSAGSPFGMLAPAIRRQAGILDGEPLAARRKKLAARVGRHVGGTDRARVTEFVGELCGVPFPEEASVQLRVARADAMVMGDQMRRAWADLVVAECKAGPLLIVLEDLHWGDLPSVKLLETALRVAADLPLMVLALARPEVRELFPNAWAEQGVTELSLPPLTRRAAERLVREVVGASAAADLVTSVVERAAGNAFYLEELIRAVVGGKAESFPETVLAMVQARLEGLEPEARRVLRAASVFGQVFWRGGVAALLGAAKAETVHEWLCIHERSELISARPLARFPGEEEYVFRHALVREAAYAMLTDADRVLGHRLAGRWLEAAGEGDAMVMAEHLERGGSSTAAVAWYRVAAVQALEGNDFDAAVRRADRAIACGAVGEERGALHLIAAEANRWRGEHAAARTTAMLAIDDLPRGAPPWYAAIGEAVLATGRMGLYDDLASLVGELEAAAETSTPCAAQLAATARAGFYLLFAGKSELAARLLAWIDRVQAELAAADPATRGRVHQARALGALAVADAGAYLTEMQASADSFLEAGDLRSACSQRTNTGFAYVAIGAPQRGARELRQALVEADAMGLYTVAAMLRTNLGLALTQLGQLEEARLVLERAVEALSAQGDARLLGAARSYLAALLLRAGRAGDAEREAREAVSVLASTPPARAYALAVLARVLLELDRIDDALREAERAMSILNQLGGIEEGEVLVRLVHADALRRAGRMQEARAAIAQAAHAVRERAAKIRDAAWQKSFLENVPENARTLELAASW